MRLKIKQLSSYTKIKKSDLIFMEKHSKDINHYFKDDENNYLLDMIEQFKIMFKLIENSKNDFIFDYGTFNDEYNSLDGLYNKYYSIYNEVLKKENLGEDKTKLIAFNWKVSETYFAIFKLFLDTKPLT